ncbi:PfkB family carbohydrate kinase [Natrialba asiatica]|uniref:PfkB domain-containing protein n=1 Tax=Natrialba asiatica (strain ATCC 700177 / DSM 12278 / JCM 9576 / FERM P-10747 / NBRC 102637 / 172P1) TaxID=29540 RepID=M0AKX1_NATA1|nr:PfkB family carbohydrate kinase [Natrialba asiatica]ELY99199.1 PfkB domain-containing protein [Natrialba asiatica DSM 12278]
MSYDALSERLSVAFDSEDAGGESDESGVRVVSLPDGSVDYFYSVEDPQGRRLDTPAAFGRRLTDGEATFPLTPTDTQPGGQATNAAMQIHELGERATLVGHLDHPVFDEFGFETYSMGTPATINVLEFGDGDVLLPEPGPTADWTIAALDAVVDWPDLIRADAFCCVNWVSVRGLTDVFDRLASDPPETNSFPIIVDPGAIGVPDETAVEAFFRTLAETDAVGPLDVVCSVNPTEFDRVAAVLDVDGDRSHLDRLAAARTALGVHSVVIHGPEAARAATPDGVVSVDMLETATTKRTTGAGDRFSGALACALARGWSTELALALANACAAHFVATAETATPGALRAALADHGRR